MASEYENLLSEDLGALIAEYVPDFTYTATPIPSRTDGGIGDDARWNEEAGHFVIEFKGKGRRPFSFQYSAGAAHRVWGAREGRSGLEPFGRDNVWIRDQKAQGASPSDCLQKRSRDQVARDAILRASHVPAPQLREVLECMDFTSHSETFDDWCGNFGYDSDSIKARAIYDRCCDLSRGAVGFFGLQFFERFSGMRD